MTRSPNSAPMEHSSRAAVPARPLRVIVVDDDLESRVVLHNAIRALGHDCHAARDGEEAWALHRASPADVMISDWMMPNCDGLELCRRVRDSDAALHYTYFIFATGMCERARFIQGMGAGADDYMTKPVDLDEIEARLGSASRVLALHRRLADQARNARRDSQRLFVAAHVDTLTGCENRLALDEYLAAEIRGERRARVFTAAMCDVDLFKHFNDRYGHLAGDRALRSVADSLRASLRRGDHVFRYGGEEFLVLLPEQRIEQAIAVMNRAREQIARTPIDVGGGERVHLSVSIGIAQVTSGPDVDCADWICRADDALYRAKRGGRNRVEGPLAG